MTGIISLDSCLEETAGNLKLQGLYSAISQVLPELAKLSLISTEMKPSLLNVYRFLKGRALFVQGARVSDYGETVFTGT